MTAVLTSHIVLDDQGRPFRWSDVYGYVLFPGLGGSRPFTLSVALDPGRPAPVVLMTSLPDGSPAMADDDPLH